MGATVLLLHRLKTSSILSSKRVHCAIGFRIGKLRLKCNGTRAETSFRLWGNERVHLKRRGHQFSRLLAAEVCASAVVMVVMLDAPCSEVAYRVLATHFIRQFTLHFPSHASPCAITFQTQSSNDSSKTAKSCACAFVAFLAGICGGL